MANQAHVTLLRRSVPTWNAWQEQHPDILTAPHRADRSEANLCNANLSSAYFHTTRLAFTTFVWIYLRTLLGFIWSCSPVSCSINGFPRRVPNRL